MGESSPTLIQLLNKSILPTIESDMAVVYVKRRAREGDNT